MNDQNRTVTNCTLKNFGSGGGGRIAHNAHVGRKDFMDLPYPAGSSI